MLGLVAAVQTALRDTGCRPLVVGGLAVQFWTEGEYVTHDIDVALPSTVDVEERLLLATGRLPHTEVDGEQRIPYQDVQSLANCSWPATRRARATP